MTESVTKCGFVAIVGQPNVGKSTLLNQVLGKKLSITCNKPQTTRHRILGIKTHNDTQFLFVDTPGLHRDTPRRLNRLMNKAALSTLKEVDLIVLMIDGLSFEEQDAWILRQIEKANTPIILLINKVDRIADKTRLLQFIAELQQKADFKAIIPMSALKNDQVDAFLNEVGQLLPAQVHMYGADDFTDRSDRFIVSEIIREKLMHRLNQELPYSTTVIIDKWDRGDKLDKVYATIYVERSGQKKIVIGEGGQVLRQVGQGARIDMEQYFSKRFFLQLWVKVKKNWADDEKLLHNLGYDES